MKTFKIRDQYYLKHICGSLRQQKSSIFCSVELSSVRNTLHYNSPGRSNEKETSFERKKANVGDVDAASEGVSNSLYQRQQKKSRRIRLAST